MYFENREELLSATLARANDRAGSARLRTIDAGRPAYRALESALLAELDDAPAAREANVVWGELLASAVFEPRLQPQVQETTSEWVGDVARGIARGQADGSVKAELDPSSTAALLVSIVEGLSALTLAGALERDRARDLLRDAVRTLLAPEPDPDRRSR